MWIVRLALRRPYTIAVLCLLIFLGGLLALRGMLVDIFPVIDIPVVGLVWSYSGLSAEDMERRVMLVTERAMSTSVNGIARIESQSSPGIGLLKVYFQPGADIGAAIAQMSAMSSTVLKILPPGMTPPVIVQFNASNLPVAQMTIESQSLPEQKLFDYGLNFIRIKLFTIPGLSVPAPYGGRQRQINIDIDPSALTAKGLSPADVVNALQAQNIILPAGTARIGKFEYNVGLNSSPSAVENFGQIPIKIVGGRPVLMGDVARITDNYADQTNIVRVNGHRSTYLNILRKANASTLTVVESARNLIPEIKAAAPEGMEIRLDFDQSIFVRAAITSVVREAVIASILVSIMILAFLGSWRSVLIVCTSIPLAILVSIIGLKMTGNSINIMTLGGLSLAIGMLVDDATVEVENIHRNRALGAPTLTVAVLNGAKQIALPAIMATLAICIVFFPVVLLTGPARFLFVPMALSVVFAMLASYVLSRSLVPLLARLLMDKEPIEGHEHEAPPPSNAFERRLAAFNEKREKWFARLQNRYTTLLSALLAVRPFALKIFFGLLAVTIIVPFVVGMDFFPQTDTGIMKLHFRAPPGTRIEETEKLVEQVEKSIRSIVPMKELETINAMIGVPISYNLAFAPSDNTSSMDADILIALKQSHHATIRYVKKIRAALTSEFPRSSIYFQSADIVNQVLTFGLSAPLDVQREGADLSKSYEYARMMRDRLRAIPGMADVNIKQSFDYPALRINVDRIRAAQVGLTQRDVANSMLTSLASSLVVSPSYFLNPVNNINYSVAVKTPLPKLDNVSDLLSVPITPPVINENESDNPDALPTVPGAQAQRLGNLGSMVPLTMVNQISHYNIQRVVNVTGNVEGRDLGFVTSRIRRAIATLPKLPPGMKVTLRGQGETMRTAFGELGLGLVVAIMLVYLLMVVLFQSWLDPFIVLVAVPGALVGILWMLLLTGTTINVVSFLGSIMAVGIASSNSILLVSFANDLRVQKKLSAIAAALEAGKTRLRPVLMTALAMVLGMLPTAIGLGEGGEQNAPLGRAVIGGLLVATVITLFIVPIVYSLLRKDMPMLHLLDEKFETEERGETYDPSSNGTSAVEKKGHTKIGGIWVPTAQQ